MEPLLEVRALDAWYGGAQVLFGVSLTVRAGEAVVLLGRNGSGKSTTMKAIVGLEVRRRGLVQLAGTRIDQWATHEIARAGLGFVPEDRRIFKGLTVEENLAVAALPPRAGIAWSIDDVFRLFPALVPMRRRFGGQMSGGEQQMLTIGRTLMGQPRCILLDEPSEGLAPLIVETIAKAVLVLKSRGVGLLVSEQNVHFARRIADRAVIIERGSVRFEGTMADLEAVPRLVEAYLSV